MFESLYRLSVYLMLFLATLVLNMEASSVLSFAPMLPYLVLGMFAIAFVTVDLPKSTFLSRQVADLIGIGTGGLALLEYQYTDNLVFSLAHWLTMLMVVKVFLPKTVRDDWLMLMLGLGQVLVGGVNDPRNPWVGVVLVLWAVVTIWVLALFYLRREAFRRRETADVHVTPGLSSQLPYPGLLTPMFFLATLSVAAVSLILGGIIFMIMPQVPRNPNSNNLVGSDGGGSDQTGFTSDVRLGELGRVLESNNRVMTVELFQIQQRPNQIERRRIAPPEDLLWRGVVLDSYERSRWKKEVRDSAISWVDLTKTMPMIERRSKLILQKITLEQSGLRAIFTINPALALARGSDIVLKRSPTDGTLHRETRQALGDSLTYLIYTSFDESEKYKKEGRETYPSPIALSNHYLNIPESLRDPLRAYAEPIVAGIPLDDKVARAQALNDHLSDSAQFAYSLQLDTVDRDLDPVLDFLRNTKSGNCEYYASSLALLLRSIQIPSRLVSGFKGGDVVELDQTLYVRDKHAHTWVEALVDRLEVPNDSEDLVVNYRDGLTVNAPLTDEYVPVWKTFDPTPAAQRAESVAQVGTVPQPVLKFTDYIHNFWVNYIIKFDSQKQEELIYGPVRELWAEAKQGFQTIGEWAAVLLKRLFQIEVQDVQALVSIGGGLVTFFGLLLLVGLYYFGRKGFGWFRRYRERFGAGDDPAVIQGAASYRRLVRLLAEFGLKRPATETHREFGRRAAAALTGAGPDAPTLDVADVPTLVVEAYYQVRFGSHPIGEPALRQIQQRLDVLEERLRSLAAASKVKFRLAPPR